MSALGLISVQDQSDQNTILVEADGLPVGGFFTEDGSDYTSITVSESENIGLIAVEPVSADEYLVTIVVGDTPSLVTVNVESQDVSITVLTGAVQVTSVSLEDIQDLLDLYELYLGFPADNEQILYSQADGTRSWGYSPARTFTLENKSGAQVIPFDPDYVVNGVIIASADGNVAHVEIGWSIGDNDILRRKRTNTTDRRSYSVYNAPIDDTLENIHVTIEGYANVYITAQKYK